MATATASRLHDLAHRIAQQETQLAALRRQLDNRLENLNRRRERLREELRTVESELEAVSQSLEKDAGPAAAPPAGVEAKPSGQSLSEFLVQLVGEAHGQPVALARLKEETVRRGFPSTSRDLPRMVEKRASELVQRGLLRRDPATKGYLLARGTNGASHPGAAKPTAGKARGGADQARPSPRGKQAPLREILLDLFKKSGRTMSVTELAEQALEAGYQTRSKNLKDVLWVALGKMPEIERDPKGGYRLRRGKA